MAAISTHGTRTAGRRDDNFCVMVLNLFKGRRSVFYSSPLTFNSIFVNRDGNLFLCFHRLEVIFPL